MDQLDTHSKAPDHGRGVPVSNGHESSDREEDPRKSLTLAQRISAIRAECFGLGKDDIKMQNKDRTKEWTIKGHTVEAVLAGVRPLLDRHRVLVTPHLVERTYNGNRCDILVDFQWESLDDPDDTRTVRWAGADTDLGGKAFAKAGTNAIKEHFKKYLLITDRDDAKEETEVVEHQTEEQMSRSKVEAAQEQARRAMESWARNYYALIKGAKNVKALKALKAENSESLSDATLPSVTKTFLDTEYAERMKVLEEFENEQTEENKETLT